MADMIAFLMENFTLSFLVIGVVFSLVALSRAARPLSAPAVVEKFLFWFLFSPSAAHFSTTGSCMWARLISQPNSSAGRTARSRSSWALQASALVWLA